MTDPQTSAEPGVGVEARLRALRVDPPDAGFSAELHRRLAAAGPPPAPGPWARWRVALERWRPALWPAAGVAAGVAAFLVLGALQRPVAPGQMQAPEALAVQVPSSKVALIRLTFSADVAVQSAQMHVELPPGLSFWSDGEELAQRALDWEQPLSAGDNVIPIAVRGGRAGEYRVVATARVGDQRIEHDVVLKVVDG
ncbi:MAG TPA: hypothetical protein VND93_28775 [Myxococcales bacterium]|nr:hypothetical protein [Myxococcales bacterium]